MGLVKALAPFAAVTVTDEQITNLQKACSCPFHVIPKPKSGTKGHDHHLNHCPQLPAGHTCTCNHQDFLADRGGKDRTPKVLGKGQKAGVPLDVDKDPDKDTVSALTSDKTTSNENTIGAGSSKSTGTTFAPDTVFEQPRKSVVPHARNSHVRMPLSPLSNCQNHCSPLENDDDDNDDSVLVPVELDDATFDNGEAHLGSSAGVLIRSSAPLGIRNSFFCPGPCMLSADILSDSTILDSTIPSEFLLGSANLVSNQLPHGTSLCLDSGASINLAPPQSDFVDRG